MTAARGKKGFVLLLLSALLYASAGLLHPLLHHSPDHAAAYQDAFFSSSSTVPDTNANHSDDADDCPICAGSFQSDVFFPDRYLWSLHASGRAQLTPPDVFSVERFSLFLSRAPPEIILI